jgi:hypothetical protein
VAEAAVVAVAGAVVASAAVSIFSGWSFFLKLRFDVGGRRQPTTRQAPSCLALGFWTAQYDGFIFILATV